MNINSLFVFLTGLVLFLFGMSFMSSAIRQATDGNAEKILARVTASPLQGVLFGTFVTSFIQSSSAVSVMCVGLAEEKTMKLWQAKSVILGAILGTSVTGWILCLGDIGNSNLVYLFSSEFIICIVAVVGFILLKRSDEKQIAIGNVMLGFSVMMTGMSMMSSSVSLLSNNTVFLQLMTDFSNPFLGITAGCIFAALLQSASAAVGVVQALATSGMMTFQVALPLIIGISIGASLPILLVAPTVNSDGKKAAYFYLFGTLASALILTTIIYLLLHFINFPMAAYQMTSFDVALLNTIYRLLTVVVILPFLYREKRKTV